MKDDADGDAASITIQHITDGLESSQNEPAEATDPHAKQLVSRVLETALRTAPDVTKLMAQRGKYLVEFSASGSQALRNGTVTLLQRASGKLQPTLMAGSKFKENAVLVGRVGQGVATAAAVAKLVVIVAVQSQLASMERTLERIEKSVDASDVG